MNKLKVYLRPFLNWKFLICFGIAWMITNGMWYFGIWVGVNWGISWLWQICSAYVSFLYLPFTIEKVITIPIAIMLQRVFFRKDMVLKRELWEMNIMAKKDLFKVFKAFVIRMVLKRVDNGKKIKKKLFVIF